MVEDIFQRLLVDIAVELCEIRRELDLFRAGLDAVLAVAAARNAALFHQCVQAHFLVVGAERIDVEKICLNRRSRTDEVGLRADVRTGFEAAAAGHAVTDLVCRLCRVRVLARCVRRFPAAVHIDPAMNALEAFEHDGAVDQKVTNDGERARRLQADRLFEFIDE